ncbi:MAG: RDD family protein [Actinobacteria bacterium]|nr:RDD family protein [Actinomycetota bacterium]
MSQPAGWYDDPEDAEVLRYWDGVQWTTHTSPRRLPGLRQTGTAQGQGQGSSAHGQGYGSSSQGGQQSGGGQQYGSGQQYGGPQHGGGQSQDPYGGGWGQSAPEYYGGQARATTPDGQPLSGWWRRFFARIIDGILVGVLTALLIPIFTPDLIGDFSDFVDEMFTAAQAGQAMTTTLPAGINSQLVTIGLVSAVLALVYEIVMLKVASGTLGKLALGIRVRLRDEPGPLGWSTSAIRGLVWEGPGLLGNLPFIGLLAGLFSLLNGLWPLWDSKKQSLNDKIAKTNVVRKS